MNHKKVLQRLDETPTILKDDCEMRQRGHKTICKIMEVCHFMPLSLVQVICFIASIQFI